MEEKISKEVKVKVFPITGISFIIIVNSSLPPDDRAHHLPERFQGIEDIKGTVISGISDSTAISWNYFNPW